jgi:hypothetical protein
MAMTRFPILMEGKPITRLAVVVAGCAMNAVAAVSVLLKPVPALADSIPTERYGIATTRESQFLILNEFQTPKSYRMLRHSAGNVRSQG